MKKNMAPKAQSVKGLGQVQKAFGPKSNDRLSNITYEAGTGPQGR